MVCGRKRHLKQNAHSAGGEEVGLPAWGEVLQSDGERSA